MMPRLFLLRLCFAGSSRSYGRQNTRAACPRDGSNDEPAHQRAAVGSSQPCKFLELNEVGAADVESSHHQITFLCGHQTLSLRDSLVLNRGGRKVENCGNPDKHGRCAALRVQLLATKNQAKSRGTFFREITADRDNSANLSGGPAWSRTRNQQIMSLTL
jgi:hypothetical protein